MIRPFPRFSLFFVLIALLGPSFPQTPISGQEVPDPTQILGYDLGDRFTTVAGVSHYFTALAEAGMISEESLNRLDRSTWLAQVRVGQGRLILFVEDPLFRMFWYSGFQLYSNALWWDPFLEVFLPGKTQLRWGLPGGPV